MSLCRHYLMVILRLLDLSEPIDVYADWIDACEESNAREDDPDPQNPYVGFTFINSYRMRCYLCIYAYLDLLLH